MSRAVVREYWLVDLDRQWIEVFSLNVRGTGKMATFESGDGLISAVLPDLRLPVAEAFESVG